MKRYMATVSVLMFGLMILLAPLTAGASAENGPAIRRIEKDQHAHVEQRIEINRRKLPEEFQHRKNFAWAAAKVEGVGKQEYFAHSGIQNLDDLSDEAAERIRGISTAPANAVFKTLCVNRQSEVDGPDCWDRRVDTEFKILEDIAAQLGNSTDAVGRIRLYTDLYPCKSCLHVMDQFMQKYPKIQLEVLYRD